MVRNENSLKRFCCGVVCFASVCVGVVAGDSVVLALNEDAVDDKLHIAMTFPWCQGWVSCRCSGLLMCLPSIKMQPNDRLCFFLVA